MFFTESKRLEIMQRLRVQGYGRKKEADTETDGGVFGRKGKEWKLPPINEV